MATFQPIDGERHKDELGRDAFSQRFAERVLSYKGTDESIVFGLIGEWGSGKSSILNMMENHIEYTKQNGSEEAIVLRFNPWRISSSDHLIEEFFADLSSKLPSDIKGGLVKEFASILEIVTKVPTPIYSAAVSTLVGFPVKADVFIDSAKEKTEKLTQKLNREKSLEDIKVTIGKSLKKKAQPIIIIIDDIDRLPTTEIRLLFSLIRSVADFPYTRYILAVDEYQVSQALSADTQYPSGDGLEKIIQIPVHIPQLKPFQLQNWLGREVNELMQNHSGFNSQFEEQADNPIASVWNECWYRGLNEVITTPRKLVRLSQSLKGMLNLDIDEIFLPDIIVLEAMRLNIPEVFAAIISDYNVLYKNDSELKEQQEKREDIMDLAKEYGISDLLTVLFPDVGNIGRNHEADLLQHRVSVKKYMRLYLEKEINEEITKYESIQQFEKILESGGDIEPFLSNLIRHSVGDTKISQLAPFLEEMAVVEEAKQRSLKIKTILLTNLFNASELIFRQPDAVRGWFSTDNKLRYSRWVIRILKSIEEENERAETIKNSIDLSHGLSGIIEFWSTWRAPEKEHNILVPETIRDEIDGIVLQKIKSLIKCDELPKINRFGRALWTWRDIESATDVIKYTSSLEDPESVALLSGALLGWSDSGTGKEYKIKEENVAEVLDVPLLKSKVEALQVSDLSIRAQEMVRRFNEAINYDGDGW